MKRFKSILVVCQEDCQPELAIERARILAQQNGASITLVDVVSPRETEMAEVLSDVTERASQDMKARISDYHQARLAEHGQELRDAGIETTTRVLWGVVFVEIIRAVLRGGHDLVIKAINPNLRFRGQHVIGGLDMHLMRKCPCPVWILKEQIERDDLRVLAAVDPDSSDDKREGLNRLIMDLSTSVCKAERGQVHVVHAWSLEQEGALLNGTHERAMADELGQIREKVRALRAQALDRLISHYPADDKRRQVHLLRGEPGEVIPDFADSNEIDLIVMGTVGCTDVPGVFMGDTAEVILNRLNCSVLAVKPHNFRTPIELNDPITGQDATTGGPQRAVRAV